MNGATTTTVYEFTAKLVAGSEQYCFTTWDLHCLHPGLNSLITNDCLLGRIAVLHAQIWLIVTEYCGLLDCRSRS